MDVAHGFVADEGTNLAAAILSVLWREASLHLLALAEDEAWTTRAPGSPPCP